MVEVPDSHPRSGPMPETYEAKDEACQRMRRRAVRAFTLLEVVVALAVVVFAIGATYSAMLALNRFAATTRASNAAKAICEQFINEAQKVPYNPRYLPSATGTPQLANPEQIPFILQASGSGSTGSDFPSKCSPPPGVDPFDIDEDSTNGTNCRITLQTNEFTGAETVPAWVFRKVSPIGTGGMLSVRFVVCFSYGGKMHSVQLDTIRAPDSIR